jgi:hypothetical protein
MPSSANAHFPGSTMLDVTVFMSLEYADFPGLSVAA